MGNSERARPTSATVRSDVPVDSKRDNPLEEKNEPLGIPVAVASESSDEGKTSNGRMTDVDDDRQWTTVRRKKRHVRPTKSLGRATSKAAANTLSPGRSKAVEGD